VLAAQLAGRRELADITISVPHPYSEVEEGEGSTHSMDSAEKPPVFENMQKYDP